MLTGDRTARSARERVGPMAAVTDGQSEALSGPVRGGSAARESGRLGSRERIAPGTVARAATGVRRLGEIPFGGAPHRLGNRPLRTLPFASGPLAYAVGSPSPAAGRPSMACRFGRCAALANVPASSGDPPPSRQPRSMRKSPACRRLYSQRRNSTLRVSTKRRNDLSGRIARARSIRQTGSSASSTPPNLGLTLLRAWNSFPRSCTPLQVTSVATINGSE